MQPFALAVAAVALTGSVVRATATAAASLMLRVPSMVRTCWGLIHARGSLQRSRGHLIGQASYTYPPENTIPDC